MAEQAAEKAVGPLGLLGWPVAHSLSPHMHNQAFCELGWNSRHQYTLLPTRSADLYTALEGLSVLGFVGCNVTIPHKEKVLEVGGELVRPGSTAEAVGAANTLSCCGRTLEAHNTDTPGFLAALLTAGFEVSGSSALLLGAGGAARAAAVALLLSGAARIVIANRTVARAQALVEFLSSLSGTEAAAGALKDVSEGVKTVLGTAPDQPQDGSALEALEWEEGSLRRVLGEFDLLVNCTPVGLEPGESPLEGELEAARAELLVFDTLYRPRPTRLLKLAAQRGLQTADGLNMLVFQGALSWNYWFDRPGPVAALRRGALKVLDNGGE